MSYVNFDESFHKRVAIARNASGLTQEQLANYAGIGRRQVAAYEAGTSKPRKDVLVNLAAALGTTIDWLTSGKGDGPDTSHVKKTITVRQVPLLSHVQVMGIGFDFDDFIRSASVCDFIPAPPEAGEYAFAIQVNGNSMESPSGISFPDGTIIIVDPEEMPENGDFGLFILDDNDSFTFKQYIRDQGQGYLKPLNPTYPMIPTSSGMTPIGKVIAAQQSFSKSWKASIHSRPVDSIKPTDYEALQTRLSALESKLDNIIELLSANKKPT
ncbi:LexA family protein [Pantoea sp. RRHST58]|uniref:LexA family protein n=1 Tax=Pantoea sp. RRHST58 TaxID=3425183 RepID=UPI003DA13B2F